MRVVLSHGEPLRIRVDRRLPALSSLRGLKQAHDNKCPSVGKRLISRAISETITSALSPLTPGMVLTSSTPMRKGARCASISPSIVTIDGEIEAHLAPFRIGVELVSTIPGVSGLSAEVIVSEIGLDMSRFPTDGHLLSWACLSPRNDESAGKRRSTRMRKGSPWLKTTLIQCAWAAKRKKGSYLQAQFLRLKSRRGPQKAICAVAASILTAAYHMLKDGTLYQDLGADHFKRRSKTTQTQRLVKRLQHHGYAVDIKPLAT